MLNGNYHWPIAVRKQCACVGPIDDLQKVGARVIIVQSLIKSGVDTISREET